MDSTALIPVHWGWFWFQLFLFLTFFIHILLMNVMLGTGFIALVSHFRRDVSSPCTKAVFTATCLGATSRLPLGSNSNCAACPTVAMEDEMYRAYTLRDFRNE